MGKFKEAMQAYDKAISLSPKDAEAYFQRGVTLRALGKADLALQSINKALEINPNHPEAYVEKG